MPASSSDLELLQGTLDVMILKALSWGAMHGFGVAKWIRHTTDDVLQIEDSALYPALHRMEHRGLIAADWGLTENNRRAKYYTLTTKAANSSAPASPRGIGTSLQFRKSSMLRR